MAPPGLCLGDLCWFVSLPEGFGSMGMRGWSPSSFPPVLTPPSLIRASRERTSILLFPPSRAAAAFLGRQKED